MYLIHTGAPFLSAPAARWGALLAQGPLGVVATQKNRGETQSQSCYDLFRKSLNQINR